MSANLLRPALESSASQVTGTLGKSLGVALEKSKQNKPRGY